MSENKPVIKKVSRYECMYPYSIRRGYLNLELECGHVIKNIPHTPDESIPDEYPCSICKAVTA